MPWAACLARRSLSYLRRLLDGLLGRDPSNHLFQLLVGLFSRPGRECPRRSTLRAADVVSKRLTTLVFCADGSVILAHGAGFVTKLAITSGRHQRDPLPHRGVGGGHPALPPSVKAASRRAAW